MKLNNKALFIFTRDLRLEDNTGLIEALNDSEEVLPCFIINPEQVNSDFNKYKSENAIQFMHSCLNELTEELRLRNSELLILYGDFITKIKDLHKKEKLDAIYINNDYTPYSKKRENDLKKLCAQLDLKFKSFEDYVLNAPNEIKNKSGTNFTIFTPYYKAASQIQVKLPLLNKHNNYSKHKKMNENLNKLENFYKHNKHIALKGGRKEALKILKNIKNHSNYEYDRNNPYSDKTTHLSAHLKFGTISIREAYKAINDGLGQMHPLIRQLYWRDFFYQIAENYPYVFGKPFNKKYSNLKWENDPKKLEAWKNGKTGFPIVDAGIRELNTTGYMHNRVRMIVASFLVKDLHIDWRLGEQYFASKLIDYDPCINNGNWQWCASTGCDSQPYFRIFNPWLQQKKFDEKAEYIKKWIPELKQLNPEEIHNIQEIEVNNYPKPIVNHDEEKIKSLNYFRNI